MVEINSYFNLNDLQILYTAKMLAMIKVNRNTYTLYYRYLKSNGS